MLPELAITSPLIGPFVDRTDVKGEIEGNTHLGVAIWWSSHLGSMRGDVVRRPESNYWREHLGFAQWPDFNFEEVFDALFSERSERLFEFLDELGEFIRVTKHSTLHSRADRWLNPALAARGFSLGHARAHSRGVTIPLVWVFRRKVENRWLGMPYIGVDYLEWTEVSTTIRQGHYVMCRGFASEALRRFAVAQAVVPTFRWFTDEGERRMRTLFDAAAARRLAKGPKITHRRSAEETATLARLRRLLRQEDSCDDLTSEVVSGFTDNGFLSLLRSGITAGADRFCTRLISLRTPVERTHEDVMNLCLGTGLLGTAEAMLPLLPKKDGRFDAEWTHLLSRAATTGNLQGIQWALKVSPPENARVLQHAIERAAQSSTECLNFLLNAPETQHLVPEAMLLAFRSDVFFQRWNEASQWLDLGLRPFSVEPSEPADLHELLRPGALAILRRLFSVEPPTDASLRKLLGGYAHGGAEAELFLEVSRATAGHEARMSHLLLDRIMDFIYWGHENTLSAVVRAAREGGSLREYADDFRSKVHLLRGHGWKERQDRLISVVGDLQKAGLADEAKIVASLKRGHARHRRSRLAEIRQLPDRKH
jgi:hypothetical protein